MAHAAHATTAAAGDLSNLSIEELGAIQVTSVSKAAESVSQAPSSIVLITRDDVVRSGANTVPEILRIAPNLHVSQTSASQYVITARGFNGNSQAQSFSNKLLVMIDGRSVYSPLYSGVYWDMQDLIPQDIDRIEVISGPGATLWGANAINGVINITTRSSADTQGGLLSTSAGNLERTLGLRYGGRLSDSLTYRAYVRGADADETQTATGADNQDGWRRVQGGFRLDWAPSAADLVTVQGDASKGVNEQTGGPDEILSGRNVLGRWSRRADNGSALQVQAYYDRVERATESGGGKFAEDTYDLDIQHSFTLDGGRHSLVWGGGVRRTRYRILGTPSLLFSPAKADLDLSNLFVQDSVQLPGATRLVIGLKIEDDPYVDPEPLPSVRLMWTPSAAMMVWGAVSRAVRSPTPFDRDVIEKLGGVPRLIGGADFQTEKLIAYEVGTRLNPTARSTLSVSAFYNVYDDLRSIEFAPGRSFPLHWGNGMTGYTYGVEAWGQYQVTDAWRLAAGLSTLDKRLDFSPGASRILGVAQAGDDPKYRAALKSSLDIGKSVTFDADLRYVSALPNPRLPSYMELNSRLAWNASDRVQVALSGFNLLHDRHQEYPGGAQIPRSAAVDIQWRF